MIPETLDLEAATARLHSPGGVALEVARLCQKEDTSVAELARAVRVDPALMARLVKAANSPALGRRRPALAAHEALIVLGMPVVRQLAFAFSLVERNRRGPAARFDYEAFWQHSLMTALYARALAARLAIAAPEDLMCCGLLADIGKLAIASAWPDRYDDLLSRADELTLAFLRDWGFPPPLLAAIGARRNPQASALATATRTHRIAEALNLAEQLAAPTLADERLLRSRLPPLLLQGARLGLDADALTALSEQVVPQWREWAPLLQLSADGAVQLDLACAESAQAGLSAAGEAPLALVVDDDPAVLPLLGRLVAAEGYRVERARNGREALEAAMRLKPRLVVTDWVMPVMDGASLARALRESRSGRAMYIILVSALEDEGHLVAGFGAGVDDYVTKPVVPRVFAARLRAAGRILALQDELVRDADGMRVLAAELAQRNRALQETAVLDPLTGLPARRYGLGRLARHWAAARRRHGTLAVIVLDIDALRAIHERHGHDAAERALQALGQVLRENVRLNEEAFRLGDERFLIACPQATQAEGLACAERLRRNIESTDGSALPRNVRLTASFGVAAASPAAGGDWAQLVERAERALESAKRDGGNRVA